MSPYIKKTFSSSTSLKLATAGSLHSALKASLSAEKVLPFAGVISRSGLVES